MSEPASSEPCFGIPLTPILPAFITDELFRYCKDFRHATTGAFGEISQKTQIKIADTLRSEFDPTHMTFGRPFTPGIPIPIGLLDLPGEMTLRIWPADWSNPGQGLNEVQFNYELYRF